MDHRETGRGVALRSTFADDPDYAELIELFVGELPERVRAIEAAVAQSNGDQLRVLAHQLKGAAPGYGFATIGDAASRVEAAIRAAGPDAVDRALDETRELIDLCRAAAGAPDRREERRR